MLQFCFYQWKFKCMNLLIKLFFVICQINLKSLFILLIFTFYLAFFLSSLMFTVNNLCFSDIFREVKCSHQNGISSFYCTFNPLSLLRVWVGALDFKSVKKPFSNGRNTGYFTHSFQTLHLLIHQYLVCSKNTWEESK